jgi:hypothetical protein
MHPRSRRSRRHQLSLAAAFATLALLAGARTVSAQAAGCALLKPADVAPLVGANPVAKPTPGGTSCTWTGATAGHRLGVLVYKAQGPAAEMAYQGSRGAAQGKPENKVHDETGLGDKAYSVLGSYGVSVVVLKKGRLLQVMYYEERAGTPEDLATALGVAKKAVTAF